MPTGTGKALFDIKICVNMADGRHFKGMHGTCNYTFKKELLQRAFKCLAPVFPLYEVSFIIEWYGSARADSFV
jgi:hypothetical protein